MKKLLVYIIIFGLVSCVSLKNEEKMVSGDYMIDLKKNEFSEQESKYYSDLILTLNYDGTFQFSKPIIENIEFRKGTWDLHDDPLSGLVNLYFNKAEHYYFSKWNCKNAHLPNGLNFRGAYNNHKTLFFKKTRNKFQSICK